MTPPQVAIAGAALMGRWHAHACRLAGGRVVAVIDPDDTAARRLAGDASVLTAATLDAVDPGLHIDIVHVCTPLETHAAVITSALSRGCAVIAEKPVAPSLRETEALIAHSERLGRWIVPGHQTVFQDGVRRAKEWLAGRRLRVFDYRACSAGAAARPDHADQIAADILPHALSLLDVLLPKGLNGIDWQVSRAAAGELLVSGIAETTIVRLLISMHARPTRHDLVLHTDEGTMMVDLFHGYAWREAPGVSRVRKMTRPFSSAGLNALAAALNLARRAARREPAYPGLARLVSESYKSLAGRQAAPLESRHMLAVARERDRVLARIIVGPAR
jgi:predicted dehydrogenase